MFSPHRRRVGSTGLSLIAGLLGSALVGRADAQSLGPRVETWGPNGSVSAMTLDGDTLYVGGSFDQVGPSTGAFATVSANDASAFTTAARIDPTARAVVSDGAGGWFVSADGPNFTANAPIIAHILPNGTRDPSWTSPAIEGIVEHMAVSSGRLFIAGFVRRVSGAVRAGIAALDASTGALLPWDAQLSPASEFFTPSVDAMSVDGGRVYVIGPFEQARGVARTKIAVLDAITASLLPPTLPLSPGMSIWSIAIAAGRVYLGGFCQTGPGTVCAYDLDLQPLATWTPPVLSLTAGFPSSPLAATPSAVFAVKRELTSHRVVALDPLTGAPLPFGVVDTSGGVSGSVNALSVAGGRLYIAGNFTQVNGQRRTRVASVDAATGSLDPWAPLVGGWVHGVVGDGTTVAIAGAFSSVGGIAKRNLVALDLRSGRPMAQAPDVPFSVNALLRLGAVMVCAGQRDFGTTDIDATAFSTTSGALLPWSLSSNGWITSLATDAGRLFIGGNFSLLSGVPRLHLASVDLGTAALTSWNPSPDRLITELATSGGGLYATGFFTVVPGYGRFRVAAFDTASGDVLPFNPTPVGTDVAGFGFYRDRVLLAGTMQAPGAPYQAFRWFDRISGGESSVRSESVGYVTAAAQTGDTIYAVGFLQPPGFAKLFAVDAPSGRVTTYDLGIATAGAVTASPSYVAIGALFNTSTGVGGSQLGVFRAPRAGAPARLTASVVNAAVTLGWQAGAPPAASAYVVEAGTTAGGTDVGVFNVGPATRVTGVLPPGTYFTRVRGVSAGGTGAASSEVIVTVPSTSTPPSTPGTLSASVASGVVTLSWSAAGGNATTYVIEAGTASGLTNIGTLPTGVLDTTFSTPAPSGTYFVRVRAANVFGQSPPSNEVVVAVP